MSSPPVSLKRACADGFGRVRCFRARNAPTGLLVLAASTPFFGLVLLASLVVAVDQANAQYPIRVPQTWGPHPPVLPGTAADLAPQPASPEVRGQATGNGGPAASTAQQSPPHPAVARIVVPEKDGVSYGSGTLVDARGQFGLLVTNWHVVRDAAGPIRVEFPDGFQSPAEVVKSDKDWDLAALSIYRPPAQPVPVTTVAPQPGEWLSIAGYGGGEWRVAGGQCTQYVSPGLDLPHEMVELAAEARQGDSGGPIFNQQGELAGVLFGSGPGYTSGSYGGRVMKFLATVVPGGTPGVDDSSIGSIAAARPPRGEYGGPSTQLGLPSPPPQATALHTPPLVAPRAADVATGDLAGMVPVNRLDVDSLLSPPPPRDFAERFGPPTLARGDEVDPKAAVAPDRLAAAIAPPKRLEPVHREAEPAPSVALAPLPPRPGIEPTATDLNQASPGELLAAAWRKMGGTTLLDQAKTIFALIGGLSLLVFFWRIGSPREVVSGE